MKVESLRILSKKRKQSQRADNGAVNSSGGNTLKGVKRALSDCGSGSENGGSVPACATECGTSSGASPSLVKSPSGGASPGGSTGNGKDSQRRRFVWSEPLHQDFVAAVFDIGLKCASPKLLLEMMPIVDGLTSEHIKSHLQKCRLHRQRSRQEFLKSYGYLTDLEGGKGLGGGSAAAAIKAAAAAAGDAGKQAISRPAAQVPDDSGCASKSCSCNGSAQNISSGNDPGDGDHATNGMSQQDKRPSKQLLPAASEVTTPTSASASSEAKRSEVANGGDADRGRQERSDAAAVGSRIKRAGGVEDAAAFRPDLLATASAPPILASGLLQSHLELLAKGIDLQIKFHRHLREVVNSQRALQMQLLGPHGHDHRVPQASTARIDTLSLSAVAGAAGAPKRGSAGSIDLREGPSGVRDSEAHNGVREWWDLNREALTGGSPATPVSMNFGVRANDAADASPVENGSRAPAQQPQPQPPPPPQPQHNLAASTARALGAAREGTNTPPAKDAPGTKNPEALPSSCGPEAVFTGPAVSGTSAGPGGKRDSIAVGGSQQQRPAPPGDMSATAHLNPPVVARPVGAFRAGVSGQSPRTLPMDDPVASAIARRQYVPGEYTLGSKGTTDNTGRVPPPPLGPNSVVTPTRSHGIVAAHVAASNGRGDPSAGAGLAPGASSAVVGQDLRTLQQHMQAQMEIQRSKLEAYADRASGMGAYQAWSAPGVVPAQVAPLAGVDGAGAVPVSARKGGSDATDLSGAEDVNSAAAVPKDQGPEAAPCGQQSDTGDNVFLGLLPADDTFGFDWLERGELQQAEGMPAQRPPGEAQQSLLSFLME